MGQMSNPKDTDRWACACLLPYSSRYSRHDDEGSNTSCSLRSRTTTKRERKDKSETCTIVHLLSLPRNNPLCVSADPPPGRGSECEGTP